MTRLFAVLHFFETQGKIANDNLQSMTNKQDDLLNQKEKASVVLDKVTALKGQGVTAGQMKEMMRLARQQGVDLGDPNQPGLNPPNVDANGNFTTNGKGFGDGIQIDMGGGRKVAAWNNGNGDCRVWMVTKDRADDQQNIDGWKTAIDSVQHKMDDLHDELDRMNTRTQMNLTQANDAAARVSSLLGDFKQALQETRK
ncbi:MAG: hypothetical protein U1E65_11320 [Myxococcota bacterium]